MMRIFPVLLVLAGCGGDGGGVAVPDADAFDALEAEVTALDVTLLATLPPGGTYDYRGLARLDLPMNGAAAASYFGDLVLTVSFAAADPVTGQITQLRGDGGTLAGGLTIANGRLFPDALPNRDYQFLADTTGNLTKSGVVHRVDATLAGDLRGRDAMAVAGVIYGDISHLDVVDIFDGSLAGRLTP